jgi:hypothetical protein
MVAVYTFQKVARVATTRTGRQFSSTKAKSSIPIVELREYSLFPEYSSSFWEATERASDLRKEIYPLRLFSQPDSGGELNVATHAYYYAGGLTERDQVRRAVAHNEEWKVYTSGTGKCIQSMKSTIFAEAPLVKEANLPGLAAPLEAQPGENPILEFRRYYLKLGYDTVPQFLQLYGSGLPSKLNAEGNDPTTALVTVLYNEVGRLNEVIEIWRHGNGVAAMEQSRVAARKATEWRSAIANIADLAVEFRATIHKPASFSPIN